MRPPVAKRRDTGLDANKVYLADVRGKNFTTHELDIATNLRIGLIQILNGKCSEALSSPHHNPITRLSLHLIEKMALGKCQLCNSFFEIGEKGSRLRAYVAQENFSKARESGKGMMFWNREVAKRKDKLGIRSLGDYETLRDVIFAPTASGCWRKWVAAGASCSRMGKKGQNRLYDCGLDQSDLLGDHACDGRIWCSSAFSYERWYFRKLRNEVRDEVRDLTRRLETATERLNKANADTVSKSH